MVWEGFLLTKTKRLIQSWLLDDLDIASVTCAPAPILAWHWDDRRLEREYLWAADPGGYVDECVAQIVKTKAHEPGAGAASGTPEYKGNDTTPTVLYVLTDHNANVIGLTDGLGRLEVRPAESPMSGSACRIAMPRDCSRVKRGLRGSRESWQLLPDCRSFCHAWHSAFAFPI